MRVLVTFAVDAEFAPWRAMRRFRFIDYQGLRLWRADLGESGNYGAGYGNGSGSRSVSNGLDDEDGRR